MRISRVLTLPVSLAIVVAASSSAMAESCLQHFSCELYGECRIPCIDGASEATNAERPSTPETASTAFEPNPVLTTAQKPKRHNVKPKPLGETPHIFAGRDIRTLDDLDGKPVSFGLQDDHYRTVVRRWFDDHGLKVREIPLDLDNAVDGVSTGDLAAVAAVDTKDVAKLRKRSSNDLHMIAIPDSRPKSVSPPHGRFARAVVPVARSP